MTEKFRPNLHFSPRAGWMNDPNGSIRVDGIWHLFFQHDPESTNHGPMHWGHSTSTDLVHWSEQEVALYPTELGTCFSGSAVETVEGAIKLFYTAHGRTVEDETHEVQCLVHADRSLTRFDLDPANPVVPNPGVEVFRDPRVIWHAPTKRWIMLVTQGQSVGFYGSTDLKTWAYLSSFGEGHGRHSTGPWECPDIVPLIAPGGETVWVLIVGLNPGAYAPGSGTQYFIGQFDGATFTNANPPETELWLDHGRDYYAAQTFFERNGTTSPTAIAWASNWIYARQAPTKAFRGVMSLPRELRLVDSGNGLRVAAHVPHSVHEAFGASDLPGTYRVDLTAGLAPREEMAITLFEEDQPHFIVRRDTGGEGSIRTLRKPLEGMNQFEHDYGVRLTWPANGVLDLTLFVDRGLVELSAADGLVWITNLFFPADASAPIAVERREPAHA